MTLQNHDEQDFPGNDLGEVHPCDCGGVNLTIGSVTLHLAPDEVPALHQLTGEAMQLVESQGPLLAPREGEEGAEPDRKLH